MNHIDDFITELFELEPIKVWSLIVTILGDLDGGHLTGKQLRAYLDPLEIKPAAIRVALHRLKKDGWINTQKSGREVTYSLSVRGLNDTASVYDDVYGREVKFPEGWQILILSDAFEESDTTSQLVKIGRSLAIAPKSLEIDVNFGVEIQIIDEDIPIWFQNKIIKPETLLLAENLIECLAQYKELMNDADEKQAMIIRFLFLHHWRKMALRLNCWAHIGFLPNGAISQFQQKVTEFLHQSKRTSS